LRRTTTHAAVAALLAGFLSTPALAKPPCYSAQEIRAMQVRQLQVELMVGALKCQSPEQNLRDKYSSFVNRFNAGISANAQELRAMFKRQGKGEKGMDRYMTELSNDASIRSAHIEDYCTSVEAMFDKALTLRPQELSAWAADSVEKPTPAVSCSAPEKPAQVRQAKAKSQAKPAADKKKSGEKS
jgi:hypothetical protein